MGPLEITTLTVPDKQRIWRITSPSTTLVFSDSSVEVYRRFGNTAFIRVNKKLK